MRYTDLFEEQTPKAVKDLAYAGFIPMRGWVNMEKEELKSWEGIPQEMSGDVEASHNEFTSLHGAPQIVGGSFDCGYNLLTTLEGGPHSVGGNYNVQGNKLISLKGSPSAINGEFNCLYNPELHNLVGGPKQVKIMQCGGNHVTNVSYLEGAPSAIDMFCMDGVDYFLNKASRLSLSGIEKVLPPTKKLVIRRSKVTNALGVILLKGLTSVAFVSDKEVSDILNKYLGQGRKGMMLAQAELVQIGREDAAQL
jgi:hypothetical protein